LPSEAAPMRRHVRVREHDTAGEGEQVSP
jgi:hypothetical protein